MFDYYFQKKQTAKQFEIFCLSKIFVNCVVYPTDEVEGCHYCVAVEDDMTEKQFQDVQQYYAELRDKDRR